jgi:ectoine hydroxylase-related dioxygenase (phytanoyl-CoA dioxygenase family)
MTDLKKRFDVSQKKEIQDFFVEQGYVVVKDCFPRETVLNLHDHISSSFENYSKQIQGEIPYFAIAREIAKDFLLTKMYLDLIKEKNLVLSLEHLVGPDISLIDHINFWINDKADESKVANKTWHQEYWSGPNEHDITVWFPVHGVEKGNGMKVVPGSHYYGHMPHRNREMLPQPGFQIDNVVELDYLEQGDAILFHSFLVHSTAGSTNSRRISSSMAFRNSFAPKSYKYQTFGTKTIQVGPMSRVLYGLGNDQFLPLRTYGGAVSNDQTIDNY